jgi:hypothetical protein
MYVDADGDTDADANEDADEDVGIDSDRDEDVDSDADADDDDGRDGDVVIDIDENDDGDADVDTDDAVDVVSLSSFQSGTLRIVLQQTRTLVHRSLLILQSSCLRTVNVAEPHHSMVSLLNMFRRLLGPVESLLVRHA